MRFIKGNLLEAEAQALVNTVNTVGVMGKGIALQFKEAFPNNFKAYVDACKRGELSPGKLLAIAEPTKEGEKIIINFPTKTEWYLKSKYEYIEDGLKELVKVIRDRNIRSIAVPPLGCGNGGLKWEKVRPMIEEALAPLVDVDIQVYEPNEAVKEQLKRESSKESKLTPARAMLLYALFYYEAQGESISLFVANKLAYFLQRLGEKDFQRLKFEGHHYGPYSVGVEHLLHHINGKYLNGLEQMNAKAFEPLELQYEHSKAVSDYVKQKLNDEQRTRLKALFELIHGFETAFSLELLATVDYIRKTHNNIDKEGIANIVAAWSQRKQRMFQDKYLGIALEHLNDYSNQLHIA